MKLIDKDALVAEIKRRISLFKKEKKIETWSAEASQMNAVCFYARIAMLEEILSFLDTLEVKEMNLDNFIKEKFNKYSFVDGYGQLSVSYNMAEFHSMIKRLINAQKGE